MAKTYADDSSATLDGGKKGFMIGALGGAILFGLITLIMDRLEIGTGGAVLAAMGGAAFGGLAGTILGALTARRRVVAYSGPERRTRDLVFNGVDRRMARQ